MHWPGLVHVRVHVLIQVPVFFTVMAWQATDPLPPQRVDPKSVPMPATNEPVEPRQGPREDEGAPEQRPRPRDSGSTATAPVRLKDAPSVFTDEAYRQARIRSLLYRALDERGW